ncbi:signal peptidase II [Polaromonas sp. YR568]|uniref:signal peptidase II n=1 Tax=Polaromonas sp. YR568 TaxID=1855301 RepID=UPI0008E36C36|nr:signal peptidase II [Polaromonas sp. YR568]SFU85811.1 signal peptidase II [Polaromonas sp. YR568]
MSHPNPPPADGLSHSIAGPRLAGYLIALILFLADQAAKYWVHEYTPYAWSQPVTGNFNLVHVWNYGAAFSFLADAGGWQRFFFGGVALVVSAWLIFMLRKPPPEPELSGYALILGGALSNGLDRALRGYVVDFLGLHVRGWHWPAFNFADVGIVCGAALLLFAAWKHRPAEDLA